MKIIRSYNQEDIKKLKNSLDHLNLGINTIKWNITEGRDMMKPYWRTHCRNPSRGHGERTMSFSNYVTLPNVVIKRITDKAMLVDVDNEEVWIPLSQVADSDNYEEGDEGSLSVTDWIAREKGLEHE